MQLPIDGGDRGRVYQLILLDRVASGALADSRPNKLRVDTGIDNQVCDVDVLWRELARRALGDGAQPEFTGGKCRVADAPPDTRRCTSEKNRTAPVHKHEACGVARGEEACVTTHLPYFAEDPLGRLEQRKIDVAADVEDADFEWCCAIGLGQESCDRFFLARV